MSYKVYRHISPDGKCYIGLTQQTLGKRFQRGLGYKPTSRFGRAIAEFGWDSFRTEILSICEQRLDAELDEVSFISLYRSTDPAKGYNVEAGGLTSYAMSEEGRRRISQRMLADNNPSRRFGSPMKGKKHTAETKRKMSEAAKQRHIPCSDTKRHCLRESHAFEKRAVYCLERDTIYPGIHEAAEAAGCKATKICAVCKGRRRSTGGLHWRYA